MIGIEFTGERQKQSGVALGKSDCKIKRSFPILNSLSVVLKYQCVF